MCEQGNEAAAQAVQVQGGKCKLNHVTKFDNK